MPSQYTRTGTGVAIRGGFTSAYTRDDREIESRPNRDAIPLLPKVCGSSYEMNYYIECDGTLLLLSSRTYSNHSKTTQKNELITVLS